MALLHPCWFYFRGFRRIPTFYCKGINIFVQDRWLWLQWKNWRWAWWCLTWPYKYGKFFSIKTKWLYHCRLAFCAIFCFQAPSTAESNHLNTILDKKNGQQFNFRPFFDKLTEINFFFRFPCGIFWNNYLSQCRGKRQTFTLVLSRLDKYPPLITSTSVNNC